MQFGLHKKILCYQREQEETEVYQLEPLFCQHQSYFIQILCLVVLWSPMASPSLSCQGIFYGNQGLEHMPCDFLDTDNVMVRNVQSHITMSNH